MLAYRLAWCRCNNPKPRLIPMDDEVIFCVCGGMILSCDLPSLILRDYAMENIEWRQLALGLWRDLKWGIISAINEIGCILAYVGLRRRNYAGR